MTRALFCFTTFLLLLAVTVAPARQERPAIEWDKNTSPTRTDQAVGIVNPDSPSTWNINRYSFEDILQLIEDVDIPDTIPRRGGDEEFGALTVGGLEATSKAAVRVELDTLADLQAYTGNATVVHVKKRDASDTTGQYAGDFHLLSGDYSSKCDADTTDALYVQKSGMEPSAGAWVRVGAGEGLNITPSMFGAVGDGATDDIAALNAANDLAYTLGWGAVHLGAKTYGVSEPLTISRGIVFEGTGRETTTIKAIPGFSGNYVVDIGDSNVASPAFNTRIEDLTIHANGLVDIGVYSINAQEGSGVDRCRIRNFNVSGVHFESTIAGSLWFSLCHLCDVEIWPIASSTYGIYCYSLGNPLSTIYANNITVNWIETPSGTTYDIWLRNTTIDGSVFNLEDGDYGIYCGTGGGANVSSVSLNSSGSGTYTVYLDTYSGFANLQRIRHADTTNGVAVKDVPRDIETTYKAAFYIAPNYVDQVGYVVKPNLYVPDFVGEENSYLATADGLGVIYDNVLAAGHGFVGRYIDFRDSDYETSSDRVWIGQYSPVTGNAGDSLKISTFHAGDSGFEDRMKIFTDGTGVKVEDADYNNNPLLLDTTRIWVDDNGELRTKTAAPSSDDDGYTIPRASVGSITWDPPSLADGAGATSSSITVSGASFGEFVLVAAPYDLQDCVATGYVQAANTVEIRLSNNSGSTINFAGGEWNVIVIK